jgi:phosphatidate cytidylyltransferase
MMAKRVVSSIVLWILLGAVLWFGGTIWAIVLVGLLSLLTLREFYAIQSAMGQAPFTKLGMFFGTLITLAPFLQSRFGLPSNPLLAACGRGRLRVRILAERPPEKRVRGPRLHPPGPGLRGASSFSILVRIVTPVPGDSLTARGPPASFALWLVAVAKVCDTGALLTGPRHRPPPHGIPRTSPKKTWEGCARRRRALDRSSSERLGSPGLAAHDRPAA